MKSTGIVRNVDGLGRIVLPKELRKTLSINDGEGVEIFINGEYVMLKKYSKTCVLCNSSQGADGVVNYNGKLICKECIDKINHL